MKRNKDEENGSNLVQWLHDESSLRSRGKFYPKTSIEERSHSNYECTTEEVTTIQESLMCLRMAHVHLVAMQNTC
jgi:hypothetical protein